MKKLNYDVVVIGSGSGGLTAAKTAHGFGKKVLMIEKEKVLGGECTWTGCVPSKALIKTAHIAWQAKHPEKYGVRVQGPIDVSLVMDHVRRIIREVYTTHTPDVIKNIGIDLLFGTATFVTPTQLRVNDILINAQKFIISTGSSPFIPPIDGLESIDYFTNKTLFTIKKLPESMIILGGGAIGAEMASALNRLGVKVTVIEMQPRILPKEDEELVGLLTTIMKEEGVGILTGHKAIKIIKQNNHINITCVDDHANEKVISAQTLLVAVGRAPNINDLNLAHVGIATHKNGIVVDTTLRTTQKNVYAVGDVVGPYLFSHMAWHQAVIAVRNALIPIVKKHVDYKNIMWVTFTALELATVGLTELNAREKFGDAISIYKKTYKEIDRGIIDSATDGLAKFICDKKGNLIGAHIVGARAGDIIHEVQLAKSKGIKFAQIQPVIHAYPTYAEINWQAAKVAYLDSLNNNFFIKLLKKLFIEKAR